MRKDRSWLVEHYLRDVLQTPSTIETSFPLTMTNSNNVREIRVVNTRTADMEFSPSSDLSIACNCIKGGFLSVIDGSSLLNNEEVVRSRFNSSLLQSTVFCYKVCLLIRNGIHGIGTHCFSSLERFFFDSSNPKKLQGGQFIRRSISPVANNCIYAILRRFDISR